MQISVIVPTYRPQEYIYECLDSLYRQTLSADTWELIIVLNGCNEPWFSKLNEYLDTHRFSNARLIQTDTPGVSNARNIGMEQAQGEYITFIDDDDYVSDCYLEELLKIATPTIIAASNTIAFSAEEPYIPYYLESEYNNKSPFGIQPYYAAKKFLGGPCMKLIHRDIINRTLFDTRFRNGEDSLFMFAISCRMKLICFTSKEAVYYRRIRPNSATQSQKFLPAMWNSLRLIHAYNAYFFRKPAKYNLYFYLTRIIGSIHALFAK